MSVFAAPPGPEVESWLQAIVGHGAPIRFEALAGATFMAVFALEVGGSRRFVLRLFTDRDWLGRECDLADHEAAALTHAERTGLSAPRLVATATAAQCGVPAVLMTYLPGHVELHPRRRKAWIKGLAEALVRIHAADIGNFRWSYSSWNPHTARAMPPWLNDSTLWNTIREIESRQPPPAQPTFLHRDYHPVNILWQDGAVSGVVDWVNACTGPAGVDVAHCRINLALMYGARYADDSLRGYVAACGPYIHDPYWDIDAAMDSAIPDPHYYPPWRDFGLRPISRGVLRDRMREFLVNAVARS